MSEYITIARFTLPQDMYLVRARLENEGVQCNVRDELTVQVDNFLSQAVGGVRLQVRPDDYDLAVEILQEMEIPIEGRDKPKGYSWFHVFVYAFIIFAVVALGMALFFSSRN